jgi:hypothetical protein
MSVPTFRSSARAYAKSATAVSWTPTPVRSQTVTSPSARRPGFFPLVISPSSSIADSSRIVQQR